MVQNVECLTLRILKKKTGKAVYTVKFTNFEFQTFEITSNSRVSRIFVRPLKIGSLGLMYPTFGGFGAMHGKKFCFCWFAACFYSIVFTCGFCFTLDLCWCLTLCFTQEFPGCTLYLQ